MTEQAQEHLSRLAIELVRRGLSASFTGSSTPTLVAANPSCGLSDGISCRPAGAEAAYVWSSGHPIGPVSDLDAAVCRIQHVLRDVSEETP
jgi:hypothetical protein